MRRSKTDLINQLVQKIEHTVIEPRKDDPFFTSYRHNLCNEEWKEIIDAIIEKAKDTHYQKNPDKVRIGITLGETHFLSIAPELSQIIDIMLFFDINSMVLEQIKTLLSVISISSTLESFVENYRNAKFVQQRIKIAFNKTPDVSSSQEKEMEDKIVNALLDQGSLVADGKFFLSCEERFIACKLAVEAIAPVFYCADFLNTDDVSHLTSVISETPECEVALINITNLKEYAKEESQRTQLQHSLTELFGGNEKPLVIFSQIDKGSTLTIGKQRYPAYLVNHTNVKDMQIELAAVWQTPLGRYLLGTSTVEDLTAITKMMFTSMMLNDDLSTGDMFLSLFASIPGFSTTAMMSPIGSSSSDAQQRFGLIPNLTARSPGDRLREIEAEEDKTVDSINDADLGA